MSIQLPNAIKVYMEAANTIDNAALDSCLATDAHIYDQGESTHIDGIEAIKAWRASVAKEFELTTDIQNIEHKQGVYILTVTVSGTFPGSPVPFSYFFTLSETDLIANLSIVPN